LSAANVDLVRSGYEHFQRTGEPASHDWSPDFVWDMSTFQGWPEDPEYAGREGFDRFMANWLEPFDEWSLDVEELIDAGDKVVAILRQRGSARGGAEVAMHFAHVWTIRDGKSTRAQMYADPGEALAAAGVSA
jgi:ketosteroid isomerase-like protein